jgi:hypothetical protein
MATNDGFSIATSPVDGLATTTSSSYSASAAEVGRRPPSPPRDTLGEGGSAANSSMSGLVVRAGALREGECITVANPVSSTELAQRGMTVTDRLEGVDYGGVPGEKADNTMALSRLYRRLADMDCLSSALDGNYNFLPDRLRLELLSQSDRAETLQFGTDFDAGGEDAQCFQLLRLDKTPFLQDAACFKRWVGVSALERPDKILSLMDAVVPGGTDESTSLSDVLDNLEVLLVATFGSYLRQVLTRAKAWAKDPVMRSTLVGGFLWWKVERDLNDLWCAARNKAGRFREGAFLERWAQIQDRLVPSRVVAMQWDASAAAVSFRERLAAARRRSRVGIVCPTPVVDSSASEVKPVAVRPRPVAGAEQGGRVRSDTRRRRLGSPTRRYSDPYRGSDYGTNRLSPPRREWLRDHVDGRNDSHEDVRRGYGEGGRRDPGGVINRDGDRRVSPGRRGVEPRSRVPTTGVCIADLAAGVGVAARTGGGIVPCPHGARCLFSHAWRSLPRAEVRRAVDGSPSVLLREEVVRAALLRAVDTTPLLR